MRGLVVALAALVLASPALAGGPAMRIGAAEDFVKQPTVVEAKAKLTLARLAGFDTVRITVLWARGKTAPPADEQAQLRALAEAARLTGISVVVSVYPYGSSQTPLDAESRAQFAAFTAGVAKANPEFRDWIIGNEPNLNRFWLPQFSETGESVSAAAFLPLLAETYDALKAVDRRNVVWGIGLSPRGGDNPQLSRHTHSPTKFILDLGAAYRASGRTAPIMDGLAFHPYGDHSSQAPKDSAHPRSTSIGLADYGKLVALLGQAFDGTAQPGSKLPILYDEFGVEALPPAAKAGLYTGTEPATTRPVDEATQGRFYREAIEMAFCQPNVVGLLLFHVADETERLAWQSGVYYPDGTPKASLPAVLKAAQEARRGIVARCPGLAIVPRAAVRRVADTGAVGAELRCDVDCAYRVRLRRQPAGTVVASVAGRTAGGTVRTLRLRAPKGGRYRLEAAVRATVNRGAWRVVRGAPFTLR